MQARAQLPALRRGQWPCQVRVLLFHLTLHRLMHGMFQHMVQSQSWQAHDLADAVTFCTCT